MTARKKKTDAEAGVVPDREAVWPRRFLECTPTLGWTPKLEDEESIALSKAARRAALAAFGSVAPAPEAGEPTSLP